MAVKITKAIRDWIFGPRNTPIIIDWMDKRYNLVESIEGEMNDGISKEWFMEMAEKLYDRHANNGKAVAILTLEKQ